MAATCKFNSTDKNEWSKSIYFDSKSGKTYIHYTIKIKVVNAGVLSKEEATEIMDETKNQIKKSFSLIDKKNKTVYTTEMQYSFEDADNIVDNDFYIEFQDRKNASPFGNVRMGLTKEIGNTEKNKIEISVKHNGEKLPLKKIVTSLCHEIGHTVGLTHPKNAGFFSWIAFKMGFWDNNLMNQNIDKNQGKKLKLSQLKKIDATIKKMNG